MTKHYSLNLTHLIADGVQDWNYWDDRLKLSSRAEELARLLYSSTRNITNESGDKDNED